MKFFSGGLATLSQEKAYLFPKNLYCYGYYGQEAWNQEDWEG